MSWGDDAHLHWNQRSLDYEQAQAWERMEARRKTGLNKQTVFRDNNAETHIGFDSNNGSVLVEDELYRQAVILNLEDVEMIVKTIRKAHSEFMKE